MPISAKAKGRERQQVQNECKIVKICYVERSAQSHRISVTI